MQELIESTFIHKYAQPGETTREQVNRRVSKAIAGAERSDERSKWEKTFFEDLMERRIVPGGRISANAGGQGHGMLLNCYVVPIKDSREGVFKALQDAMELQAFGGGVGYNFSPLRPEGTLIQGTGGSATGPCSFLGMFDAWSSTINAANNRLAANMGILSWDHPDVMQFIEAKVGNSRLGKKLLRTREHFSEEEFKDLQQRSKVWTRFNVSLSVCDKFLSQKSYDSRAKRVWDAAIRAQWECGDPGMVHLDRVNELSNSYYYSKIEACNPCGEQFLPAYENCSLAHLNLYKFLSKTREAEHGMASEYEFDFDAYRQAVKRGIRFLDNVVTVNQHVLPECAEAALSGRRIGLGHFGFGEVCLALRIRYGSDESLQLAREIGLAHMEASYFYSGLLAAERGVFPKYDEKSYFDGRKNFASVHLPKETKEYCRKNGMRNVCVNTLAPVGSGAFVSGNISSGIEPHYSLGGVRNMVAQSSGSSGGQVYSPAWDEWCQEVGHQDNMPRPAWAVGATEVTPEEHVRMLATWQEFIDSSVSKTVNLPEEATPEDVAAAYDLGFSLGAKAISVYRDGSLPFQILQKEEKKISAEEKPEAGVIEVGAPRGVDAPRPTVLRGETVKLDTPQGKIYVTLNRDSDDQIVEVFTVADGMGSGWCNALGRLISISLRHGVPMEVITKTLTGILSGEARMTWFPESERPLTTYSAPDAIGKLLNLMASRGIDPEETTFNCSDPNTCMGEKVMSEGCLKCLTCGFSKCG